MRVRHLLFKEKDRLQDGTNTICHIALSDEFYSFKDFALINMSTRANEFFILPVRMSMRMCSGRC